jgi:hypothetical protein
MLAATSHHDKVVNKTPCSQVMVKEYSTEESTSSTEAAAQRQQHRGSNTEVAAQRRQQTKSQKTKSQKTKS